MTATDHASGDETMKTVLITNGNLTTLIGIGDFLRCNHQHLAAVFITTRLPSQNSNWRGLLSIWRKSGFAYTHFKLLTNVLLPRSLRRSGRPGSVADYLRRLGTTADLCETTNINAPEVVDRLRAYKPEILISASATMRFSDTVIGAASRAAVNAHYSLLPEYAGLSPYFWYLRNREPVCGATLHRIDSRLDGGPVIEQSQFSMDGLRTVLAVLLRQLSCVSPMLNRYYAGETSERTVTEQDRSARSYFGHPTRSDIRALHRHAHRFYEASDCKRLVQIVDGLIR